MSSASANLHAAQGGASGSANQPQLVGPDHVFLAGYEYGITRSDGSGWTLVECFGAHKNFLYFAEVTYSVDDQKFIYAFTEAEARNNIILVGEYGAMVPVNMQLADAPWYNFVLRWTPNVAPSDKDRFVELNKLKQKARLEGSLKTLKNVDLPREQASLTTDRNGVDAVEAKAATLQTDKAKLEADIKELDCFLGGKMNATQVLKADIEDKKTSLRDAEVALAAQLQTAQGKLNQAVSQFAACANDSAKRELARAECDWCELEVKNVEKSLIANREMKKSITDLIDHHEGSLNRMNVSYQNALAKKTVMEHKLATEFSSEAVKAGVDDAHKKLADRFNAVRVIEADIAKKTGMVSDPFHAGWADFMPKIEAQWISHNARKRPAENDTSAEKVSRQRVDNDGAAGGAGGGPA